MIMETIMEMAREKEMVNINLKEAFGSLFFIFKEQPIRHILKYNP